MEPTDIIKKYYPENSRAYYLLTKHGELVANKALKIAENVKNLNPNKQLIKELAMLHDIGMFLTNAPQLDCHGKEDYMRHGILGKEILQKEGLLVHAAFCESHIGIGFLAKEIEEQKLSLPIKDVLPLTIEEELVSFADIFFTKLNDDLSVEKDVESIRIKLKSFGGEKLKRFDALIVKFKYVESSHN
jgi:uncharacterized protein